MAVDKLVDSSQLDSDLTSVANAIRAKSGGSGQLAFPAGFVSEIQSIVSGGGGLTLLGSGSYTWSGNGTSVLIISVTYTGTPKVLLALKDELDTGVGETIGALRVMATGVQTVDDAFTYGACAFKIKQSNDTVGYAPASSSGANCIYLSDNFGNYKADGSYMRVLKYGNAYLMQPGAYSWYIWG
jgi:hypothetical protein